MAGVVLISLSLLIFIVLFLISMKDKKKNQSQQYTQEINKNKAENTTSTIESNFEKLSNTLESDSGLEDDEDATMSNLKSYSPKSYKDDEDYKRMASLVKNIYFSLVGFVFVLLGVLYIIFFK